MATPTSPEKRLHARGFKKASEWGTAVALGAGDEVVLEEPSGLQPPEIPIISDKGSDRPYVRHSDFGLKPSRDFVLPVAMRYEPGAFGTLLAMLFGTAGAPTDLTGAYQHVFQWKDEISSLFGTWAEERAGKIFEVPSAKPYRLELSFSGGMLKARISMRGDNCIDTSTVNQATQMDALTVPANFDSTAIRFKQGSVKINAENNGDVSTENALVLTDFSVVLERLLEGDDNLHTVGTDTIIEPLEEDAGGAERALVTLRFPRMNAGNATYLTTALAETTQKMLIKFTGALISGSNYYDLALYFPRLKMQIPTFDVEQIVRSGLVLQAEEAAAAPTGMSYARLYAELINNMATDYLA